MIKIRLVSLNWFWTCIQLRGDKITDWKIKLELEQEPKLLLNFTDSRYIAFKAKSAQINGVPFFIYVLTKVINLVSKKESGADILDKFIPVYWHFRSWIFVERIFFRTDPLKESERPILYRPLIYRVFLCPLKCPQIFIKRPSLTVCTTWSGIFLWIFLNLPTAGPTSTSEQVKNTKNF